ncbi:head maturation protease, ClpP-related [Flavobacterium cerinum]|nr:head maturation protease, ClpP-related [Flavobacterium cerinum]
MSQINERFYYEVNDQANEAEILIYGYIGPWEAVDYKGFQNDFRQLLSRNKDLTVRIHSGGGSVYEGLAIYDLMRSSEVNIRVIVEGMAASMASIIALGGDTIEMTENAFFMMHAPSGGYWGSKSGFQSYIQQLEQCETRLGEIYKERTKADEETIVNWFSPDKDTWLDSSQCLALSICDEIIKPTKKRKFESEEDLSNKSVEEIFACYEGGMPPLNESLITIYMKNRIITMLAAAGITHSLTASSDDDAFAGELQKVLDKAGKADGLQNKLTEFTKVNAENLIAAALKDGKITPAEKEEWTKDATDNYELTAKALNRMAGKPGDINNSLNRKPNNALGNEGHDSLKGRSEWDFDKWQTEDPKGLNKLEAEAPDEFQKLFNAKFTK